jgi:hypothetical protein
MLEGTRSIDADGTQQGEGARVSDHAILGLIALIHFIVGVIGIVILALQLKQSLQSLQESQRLTRAVAGLVYLESDRIRRLFDDEK